MPAQQPREGRMAVQYSEAHLPGALVEGRRVGQLDVGARANGEQHNAQK